MNVLVQLGFGSTPGLQHSRVYFVTGIPTSRRITYKTLTAFLPRAFTQHCFSRNTAFVGLRKHMIRVSALSAFRVCLFLMISQLSSALVSLPPFSFVLCPVFYVLFFFMLFFYVHLSTVINTVFLSLSFKQEPSSHFFHILACIFP